MQCSKDRIWEIFQRRFTGLSNTEIFATAAAPMNPEVHKWFHAIHIDVWNHGMTEDTGPATIGIPNHAINYVESMFNQ